MKIRAGYEISYDCPQPTPMILTLSVYPSRTPDLLSWDRMRLDLSAHDIMVVQIDIHLSEHLVLVAALGIDCQGFKHPLRLMEGATEHSAVVQALIDDLIERGLDPAVPRLFIMDGSKALAKAIRRSFGRHTPITGAPLSSSADHCAAISVPVLG